MSTPSVALPAPGALGSRTSFSAQPDSKSEEYDLSVLPVLESEYPEPMATGTSKVDSRYDLHALPTYLSERSRRPSALIRKDSDLSVTREVFRREVLNAPITLPQTPGEESYIAEPTFTEPISSGSSARPLTPQQKRSGAIHFLTVCWCLYLVGWNDGSTGALLPRIREQYNIGYSLASLIFVGNCSGYLCGAALNVWFNDRIGFGKIITLGAACQSWAYIIIITAPPFPVLGIADLSQKTAQANGLVGGVQENMSTKLCMMHGSYGLGAFTSPFAATYFATFANRRWAFHFTILLSFTLLNIAILTYVFRFRRQEEILLEAGQENANSELTMQQGPAGSKYREIIRARGFPLCAMFALIYVGVEGTLGGWIVTYIIRERNGGASAGYISSGFFGGLTLGRVGLIWLNKLVGERRVIFVYATIAIGLELTVWFVPSIIGNAVAISLIGLVLGPTFPLLVQHMSHLLPRWLLTGCVGLVSGIGITGSAALSFVTGLLASKYGIGSLQPL
ncbi:hypothetical protein NLJ89_g5332 [Agrocybe chaxingu]|uniref:Major facilitator superfamily (MFS) profile domain-containing protein n=1 Tax=Agrocybe chaxingu TaxID=84603 RepID=A0A9W8MXB6_9AGAR|nr:hypothetical protein NLJ89_g5332 [Agrocybe chaxingu]